MAYPRFIPSYRGGIIDASWLQGGNPLQIGFAAWTCTLIGLACAPVPDVAIIQSAYQREAGSASKTHDQGLRVVEAKCHDAKAADFLCEVTFTSTDDPTERLYFDIVAVARNATGWELKSGLCKR
jgi:hypothetical protein